MVPVKTKKIWGLVIALFVIFLIPKFALAICPTGSECMTDADCKMYSGGLVQPPPGETGCTDILKICCAGAKPVGPSACDAWPAPCGCQWKGENKPIIYEYITVSAEKKEDLDKAEPGKWECQQDAYGATGGMFCCNKKKDAVATPASTPAATTAKTPSGGLKLVGCVTSGSGDCTVEDIVKQGVYFAQFIMGLSGSLFLIVFIYGGACYLLSFGRSSWVEKGKKAMIQSVIGIVLVLGAWTIVNYVATSIGYTGSSGTGASSAGGATAKQDTCGTSAAKKGSAGWSCQMTTALTPQVKAKCVSGECMSNSSNDYKCCPP